MGKLGFVPDAVPVRSRNAFACYQGKSICCRRLTAKIVYNRGVLTDTTNCDVVLEQGPRNWSAHVPDLPGCVAAARTREETERLIREAIEFHLEGLLLDGMPLLEPTGAEKRAIAAV